MNSITEKKLQTILSEHLCNAIEEICQYDDINVNFYWPEGFHERMAQMVTQSIALMEESYQYDKVANR